MNILEGLIRQIRITLRDVSGSTLLLMISVVLVVFSSYSYSYIISVATLYASGFAFIVSVMMIVHNYLREVNPPSLKLANADVPPDDLRTFIQVIKEGQTEILSSIGKASISEISEPHHLIMYKADYVKKSYDGFRDRLLSQISRLWKFANTNLTLGTGFSLIGLCALLVFIYNIPTVDELSRSSSVGVVSSFLLHFIPRLTLVSFIEIFAYFFLRLYRNAISEIRFFQNELTNSESVVMALHGAIFSDDKDLLTTVVTKLANVERNGTLKKGETTIELIREERFASQEHGIIDEYKKLVEMLKPFSGREKSAAG